MNAPSLLRIVGGVTLVVGGVVAGKTVIKTGQKVAASKKAYLELDAVLDQQEKDLDELRKTRESLLK